MPSTTGTTNKIDYKTVIAVLGLLFGSGLVFTAWQAYQNSLDPRFGVAAINTLGSDDTYEVTNHIIGANPEEGLNGVTLNWGLEVYPTYSGDRQYGEVRVLVKNPVGEVVAEGKWDNFNKDSPTLAVPLNPYRLASSVPMLDFTSVYQENIFQTRKYEALEAVFDVEIVRAGDPTHPLYRDQLTLRNCPWYHFTTISAWLDGAIDVYVSVRNMGDASDFAIVADVFEVTDPNGWAWNPWPRMDTHRVVATIPADGEAIVTLPLPHDPAFTFESGKNYLIATYVAKRQNYADFGGPWNEAGDIWQFGSSSDRLLLRR